jgi:1,4-dihydroxy-2-naphthoate octaprenyltransferase
MHMTDIMPYLSPRPGWKACAKTLPLAFAAIIVGSALAWHGAFRSWVALLAIITAGLLQILSNLANDYGDAVKGSDKPDRIGPLRGMQKGVITQAQMKRALIITVVLIVYLVWRWCSWPGKPRRFHRLPGAGFIDRGRHHLHRRHASLRLYRPGDISVLVFFGWLSVVGLVPAGAYVDPAIFLPAACGLLATAVLNINNLRDIDSDRENGKNTLAVRLGPLTLAATTPAC